MVDHLATCKADKLDANNGLMKTSYSLNTVVGNIKQPQESISSFKVEHYLATRQSIGTIS